MSINWALKLTPDFALGEFFVTSHDQKLLRQELEALSEPEKGAILFNIRRVAERLQVVRDFVGKPIAISSGWRSSRVNRAVGGKSKSYHLTGLAVDINIQGLSPAEVQNILKNWSGGLGLNSEFTHLDLRPKREKFTY